MFLLLLGPSVAACDAAENGCCESEEYELMSIDKIINGKVSELIQVSFKTSFLCRSAINPLTPTADQLQTSPFNL